MQKNWSSLYKINEQKYLHKNLFCFSMGYQNLNVMCSKWQWLQQRLIKTMEMRSNDFLILKRFWSLSLLLKSHLKIILKYAFANWVNCFYIDPRDGSASQQPEFVLEADLFLNTGIGNPVPYSDQKCMDYGASCIDYADQSCMDHPVVWIMYPGFHFTNLVLLAAFVSNVW